MFRPIAAITIALAMPAASFAQVNDDALERARALDACAGRPVLAAEVIPGNRLNVTCGNGSAADAGGGGLSPGAGAGLLLGLLVVLGGAAGGGGSAPGTVDP
jgi:hypothetical protein